MTPADKILRQAAALERTPPATRRIMEDAFAGTASPRRAIKAFCLACVGFTRADVENCDAATCPLHAYRPRYAAGTTDEDAAEDSSGEDTGPQTS